MDEPLGRIDPPSRKRIIEALLREYRMGEQTILISTHLVDEIEELIEDVVFLREGEIALSGNSDELRSERNQSLCDIFEEVVS
jgi:ABC-2 type transport system ATP-binding protein